MTEKPIIVDHVVVHSLIPLQEKLRWSLGEGIYTLLLYEAFHTLFSDQIDDDAVYRDTDESWHWELKLYHPGPFHLLMKEKAPEILQEMERLAKKYNLTSEGPVIYRHREEIYSDPDTHFIYLERFDKLVSLAKTLIEQDTPFEELLQTLAEKRYWIGRALLHEGSLSGELRRDKVVDTRRVNPNIRTPLLEPSYASFAESRMEEDELQVTADGIPLSHIRYLHNGAEFEKLAPLQQLQSRSIVHTERKVLGEALQHLFKAYEEWKQTPTQEKAALVIWWLAQTSPYIRGNGALVEVMTLALLPGKTIKEKVWIDFEAIFEPDPRKFSERIENYVE